MELLSVIVIIVVALVGLDVAALAWGVDSRDLSGDQPAI
jgi:hypothetical protein